MDMKSKFDAFRAATSELISAVLFPRSSSRSWAARRPCCWSGRQSTREGAALGRHPLQLQLLSSRPNTPSFRRTLIDAITVKWQRWVSPTVGPLTCWSSSWRWPLLRRCSPTKGQSREITPARARIFHPPSSGAGCRMAQRLALIVDDPDAPDPAAPKRVWVHWVVSNIPSTRPAWRKPRSNHAAGRFARGEERLGSHRLRRALSADRAASLFPQALRARCLLPDLKQPTKADLLKAMEGHILEEAD